jgi:hypothetical protein
MEAGAEISMKLALNLEWQGSPSNDIWAAKTTNHPNGTTCLSIRFIGLYLDLGVFHGGNSEKTLWLLGGRFGVVNKNSDLE